MYGWKKITEPPTEHGWYHGWFGNGNEVDFLRGDVWFNYGQFWRNGHRGELTRQGISALTHWAPYLPPPEDE